MLTAVTAIGLLSVILVLASGNENAISARRPSLPYSIPLSPVPPLLPSLARQKKRECEFCLFPYHV